MPRERLTKSVFRDAALEIYAYKTHENCDVTRIDKCIKAIEFLVEKGDGLKKQKLEVMKRVDAALREIYPGLGRADIAELKVLLEEEKEILKKIKEREPVNVREFQQISNFCQEMWFQLGAN